MNKSLLSLTGVLTLSLCSSLALNASAAYKTVSVTNGGSISGKVSFTGKDPAPKIYAITKDNGTCGTGNRTIDFVKVSNGGLADAVVYLTKVKQGKAFEEKKGGVKQKNCEFTPFMNVMTNNQSFDAVNDDPVLHNIHTYELIGRAKKTVFNVSQPQKGTVSKKVKLKRGAAMKIECDAHDFMHGFVFVAKNPYYAVVDAEGHYKIDNIPPGKYKINAWHGTLGMKKAKVKVSANGSAEVNFSFK